MKFYQCEHCGNLAVKLTDSGVPMVCCGAPMTEVIPDTRDAAVEKHVPILHQNGMDILIEVGQISHPMSPEHRILWIAWDSISTTLPPGTAPPPPSVWTNTKASAVCTLPATCMASGNPCSDSIPHRKSRPSGKTSGRAALCCHKFVQPLTFTFGVTSFHKVKPRISRPPTICMRLKLSHRSSTDTRTATSGSI